MAQHRVRLVDERDPYILSTQRKFSFQVLVFLVFENAKTHLHNKETQVTIIGLYLFLYKLLLTQITYYIKILDNDCFVLFLVTLPFANLCCKFLLYAIYQVLGL